MKMLISIIVGFIYFTQISAQEHYYYYNGGKIYLELNTDYIFVSGTNESNIKKVLNNNSTSIDKKNTSKVEVDITGKRLTKANDYKKQNSVKYWSALKLKGNLSKLNYNSEIEKLKEANEDLIISPYFKSKSSEKIGLSNYFYVKLKHENDIDILQEQMVLHKVELVGNNKFMPLWYTLSVTPNTFNAMQMANLFYETGLFEYAEPDLMVDVLLNSTNSSSNPAFTPNDTYYSDQWHLKNTGQNGGTVGIDIKAEEARNITKGTNTKVAVLDHGFEMNHPDLANNTVNKSYDSATDTSPAQVYGSHGTPCAGIIGANGNNSEGISGVAPNTGLISISNYLNVDNKQTYANGINWAWRNDADVISNSWNSELLSSNLIDEAITNALTKGRDGLGTVVVFASGNGSVDGTEYPSNSNPDILCVGGIDRCGVRSGREEFVSKSCDNWPSGWRPGSSYGIPLDVVAGGTNVLTTDRQGTDGDNGHLNLNYTYFGGTSAACPIVAGVAALVLSVNSNLTVKQVNEIIERSAQKTGPYIYQTTANRPYGDWNNQMGYGLVDAYEAVILAQSYMPNPSPSCDDGIQNGNETGIDCDGICPPCQDNNCNYTIINNTSCEVIIYWSDGLNSWNGATLEPNGNITQPSSEGYMWRAYDTSEGAFITAYETVNCSSPTGTINASACNTVNTCNYTITNNSSCEVQIKWYNGFTIWDGAIIPSNGNITQPLSEGNMWSAHNAVDDVLITPTWEPVNCSSPTGTINAFDCNTVNTCNYTIINNSSCEVRIKWYNGLTIWDGAIIPPNGNITQPFSEEEMWSAHNNADNELITPTWERVNCSSPTGTINTSACKAATCSDGIENQNETGIDCGGVCGGTCLPEGCNAPNSYVNGYPINKYEAKNFLISPYTGEKATVSANTKASFDAGDYIDLNPGFIAEYKSRFDAYIDGCGGISAPKIKSVNNPITLSNYPNPFNGETSIAFELPKESKVTLFVTDMMGKTVTTLLDNELQIEGSNTITFNGSNYPPGMYYYTIQAGDNIATQKMILME